jgi:hypothetical protein
MGGDRPRHVDCSTSDHEAPSDPRSGRDDLCDLTKAQAILDWLAERPRAALARTG